MLTDTIVPRGGRRNKSTPVCTPFLGYATLEGWARHCTSALPVYALDMHLPGSVSHGIALDRYYTVVQQRDAQGVIHYCRLKAGRVQMINGRPFGPEEERKIAAVKTLWPLVLSWLYRQHGFDVICATFAVPQDMVWLDGQAEFIRFDKERMLYVDREDEQAETED